MSRASSRDQSGGAAPSALRLWVLALAGGVLWGLCHGRVGSVWLPWIGLVPLLWITGAGSLGPGGSARRPPSVGRRLLFGWLHGVVAWLVAVPWLLPTLREYGELSWALALAGQLLLALYLGAYHAAFSTLGGALAGGRRVGLTRALFVLPALWVSLEWLRAQLFSGFPWNLAGYALVEVPGALPLAAVVGSYGLSFLLLLVNGSWVVAEASRSPRPLLIAIPFAVALVIAALATPRTVPGEGQAVRIVQPNTGVVLDHRDPKNADNYRRLLALSECSGDALLLWPESAAWPYSFERQSFVQEDVSRLVSNGCRLLFNSTHFGEDGYYNAAFLVDPAGAVSRYDKTHLVPFGEYVPLSGLFPFLDQVARNAGSFTAGEESELLAWGRERLGVSICFEIIFPGQVAARVRRGATVLVTLTNDAWYGDSAAPWQHLRAARFRAAENRRPLLRAALTGVSAIVDPWGRVTDSRGVGVEGVISGWVAGRSSLTIYTRLPWLVPASCTLGVVCGLFALVWRRRRSEQ